MFRNRNRSSERKTEVEATNMYACAFSSQYMYYQPVRYLEVGL